jgi:glycosyltransferase involved in cell wall biosynthesis
MAPYRTPVFNAVNDIEGIDLLVLYQSEECPIHEWASCRDGIHFPFEVVPAVATLGSGTRRIWVTRGLTRRLRRFRPHAVVVGGCNQPVTYEMLAMQRVLGYEGWLWIESTLRDSRSWGRCREAVKRSAVRWADGVVVPGKAAREYALALGAEPDRIRLAPNAVDVEWLSSAAEDARRRREAVRQRLGLDGVVFVCVGRMVEEKGVGDLVAAYRVVRERLQALGRGCSLLLVGSGPEVDRIQRNAGSAAEAGIVTLGFVQQVGIPEVLAASDVMVFPTWSDPWGLVVNEAQACGLPVVATSAAGAVDDLLVDTGAGIVVQPAEPAELAGAMIELALNDPQRHAMGEAARRVSLRFTPELCAEGFVAVARGSRR